MRHLTAKLLLKVHGPLLLIVFLGALPLICPASPAQDNSTVKITDEQIKLCRCQHTVWVPVEAGAPMLELVYTLRGPFDDKHLNAEQTKVVDAFQLFVEKAVLKPGTYKLKNIWKAQHPDGKCPLGPDTPYDLPIPKSDTIDFHLTDD